MNIHVDMGDVLSLCCEALVEDDEKFAAPPPKPKDIYGREWHVLAKQLKAKRNAAIQASNQNHDEATNLNIDCNGGEAQAKANQIIFLHQAMRSARSAQREQRRLQKMWRDVDRDVLESIEI